jgi:uncharacterized iron-regulated membrane protein
MRHTFLGFFFFVFLFIVFLFGDIASIIFGVRLFVSADSESVSATNSKARRPSTAAGAGKGAINGATGRNEG